MIDYAGILFIGDPHLAGRVPGSRRDDYPAVILRKLAWCLEYARERRLLPALLGDIFDRPQDHAIWVLGELLALLRRQPVIGIFGNHDCRKDALSEDDLLSVVTRAGLLKLVDEKHVWSGVMGRGEGGGTEVVIGGTSWGRWPPRRFVWQSERDAGAGEEGIAAGLFERAPVKRSSGEVRKRLVFWMMHHDMKMPGYDAGRLEVTEIEGVDMVVNGHIHRPLEDVQKGKTLWVTPGNIARNKRSEHTPSVLEVTVKEGAWTRQVVRVPHQGYEEVFHPEMAAAEVEEAGASEFVRGLSELQSRRTESGEGLKQFLELNEGELAADVREELWRLFAETEDAPAQ